MLSETPSLRRFPFLSLLGSSVSPHSLAQLMVSLLPPLCPPSAGRSLPRILRVLSFLGLLSCRRFSFLLEKTDNQMKVQSKVTSYVVAFRQNLPATGFLRYIRDVCGYPRGGQGKHRMGKTI